jgi:hypothetical protein
LAELPANPLFTLATALVAGRDVGETTEPLRSAAGAR